MVEVSKSSLRKDRGAKSTLYASCDLSPYVIVDLVNRCIEVREDASPESGVYNSIRIAADGETAEFSVGDRPVKLAVSDILPPIA